MYDSVNDTILRHFARIRRVIGITMIVLVMLQAVLFLVHITFFSTQTLDERLPEWALAIPFTLLLGAIVLYALDRARIAIQNEVGLAVSQELRELKSANDRAQSLQRMASTLSATLSFERVVEQSLDVSGAGWRDRRATAA